MIEAIEEQANTNLTILNALKKGRIISHDTWGKLSLCITRGGHPETDQPRQGIQQALDVMHDMDGNQHWRLRTDEEGFYDEDALECVEAWIDYEKNHPLTIEVC